MPSGVHLIHAKWHSRHFVFIISNPKDIYFNVYNYTHFKGIEAEVQREEATCLE